MLAIGFSYMVLYSSSFILFLVFLSAFTTEAEKAMAPHSSTLAWKIPWTEEPGGLQSMGSLRVGHDWVTSLSLFTFHALEKEMAAHSTILAWRIPGSVEPGGLLSMGSHRVGYGWNGLAIPQRGVVFCQMVFVHQLRFFVLSPLACC